LSSHFSVEVISLCSDLDIHFVCLPPNSTHICQPLDVSVFAPVKKSWRKVLTQWKSCKGRNLGTLPKEWFPRLLSQLLDAIQPTLDANIKSGFTKCGIIPVNKHAVFSRVPTAYVFDSVNKASYELNTVHIQSEKLGLKDIFFGLYQYQYWSSAGRKVVLFVARKTSLGFYWYFKDKQSSRLYRNRFHTHKWSLTGLQWFMNEKKNSFSDKAFFMHTLLLM
jgi:hypothetical protein